MHELALGQSIVDQVVAIANRERVPSISRVRVTVGAAAGVDAESLRFGFGVAAEGTPADGAVLEIRHVPLRCRCQGCGVEFEAHGEHAPCPVCTARQIVVLSGRELHVDSFDAES